MRSMNKYGVILIGGTIDSVFACCNCSGKGKENEDEKKKKNKIDGFKAKTKEYFSVDNEKNYIIKECTDPHNTKEDKNNINGFKA